MNVLPPGWGPGSKTRHKLDETHPDIEWSIEEKSEFDTKYGEKVSKYHWIVANKVTGKRLEGTSTSHIGSVRYKVANAANYLLTHDLTWSKTEPCVICEKPSRVGKSTCSAAHDLVLEKVKKEMADEVSV